MNKLRTKFWILILLPFLFLTSCEKENASEQKVEPAFPAGQPQLLDFDSISILLQDMQTYAASVKRLDQKELRRIDSRYQGVQFVTEQPPLILNSEPDVGKVRFVIPLKDHRSGTNYLLTFGKPFPVVNNETVELRIRTPDPQQLVQCTMEVEDAGAYMNEFRAHDLFVHLLLTKKFLQSGTYDFDALSIESYRTSGYPFIVFDLVEAKLFDRDANITGNCQ